MFPRAIEGPVRNYKDIYTPSIDNRENSRVNKNLFLTEAEEGQRKPDTAPAPPGSRLQ